MLAGAALSAILMAVVNALVLSDDDALEGLRQWATGSVAGRDLDVAWVVLPIILVGLALACAQGSALNLLALGETVARSLGLATTRWRILGLLSVALLGGAATAAAGPVAFVGLAAPHIVRAIVGPDYRLVVPYAALLGAALVWLMAGTTLEQAAEARLWLTGSLNGRGWDQAWAPLICSLAALASAGWLAFQLAGLSLGPEIAHGLGHRLRVAQAGQLLAAVVLAAVAVSAAGPIPFVAFVAPQIAQRLTGAATPPLWCSALTGMLLVSAADLVARTVLPWELPLGIVTAVCGAPVLIWLVLKMNRKASA
ncbi:hypothetical protein BK826_02380 [Rothia kristinae]|uniref:Iron ABC transporter permease n=1 Tax=Rothia kristinae TaxID=37923 RepID=A0A1S2N1Z8_9MICC|nr:iron chelate uptake ABC transporter family permease subunit [Rothia kristinae]OIJ36732.1 hypothetical protein BK826_02380 [Rothia kristinae]